MDTGLPPNWEVRHSKSKDLPYYFNTIDKVSNWVPPPGTDTDKLKYYMANKHSHDREPEPEHNEPRKEQIKASHLLVKHKKSRRTSSWRQGNITRTKEEAMEIIKEYEQRIRSGETTLAKLAKTESDCSSAIKDGDLGWFAKGIMQPTFQDAAFKLEVGELSGVVDSDSGLHLIYRTG